MTPGNVQGTRAEPEQPKLNFQHPRLCREVLAGLWLQVQGDVAWKVGRAAGVGQEDSARRYVGRDDALTRSKGATVAAGGTRLLRDCTLCAFPCQ